MILFLADNVEQLDLAIDQLALRDRNFDRFALMLIDNVVELTLHKFIEGKASENKTWIALGKPKYDQRTIEKGLGQNFDNKAKSACKLGLFDSELCESILNLHSYRNTAYHGGLRHERILHSLSVFYLRVACSILTAYTPRHWSWSSRDHVSLRALKYLGNSKPLYEHKDFEQAFKRLDTVAAAIPEDLVGDLAADMSETIEHMDRALAFLADDAPQKMSRNEALLDAQVWGFAFTDEAKSFAQANGFQDGTVADYIEWLKSTYKWPVKADPIPGWRERHSSLNTEKVYAKALKKYCDFMHQTEKLRSDINQSASQLDQYIQEQIDIARGK